MEYLTNSKISIVESIFLLKFNQENFLSENQTYERLPYWSHEVTRKFRYFNAGIHFVEISLRKFPVHKLKLIYLQISLIF